MNKRKTALCILCLWGIALAGCVQVPSLQGQWQWESMQGAAEAMVHPSDPALYTIKFEEEELRLALEINRGHTSYRLEGKNGISISAPIAITKAAWRPDSPAPQFLRLLSTVTRYTIDEEGRLVLISDKGTLHFSKMPEKS